MLGPDSARRDRNRCRRYPKLVRLPKFPQLEPEDKTAGDGGHAITILVRAPMMPSLEDQVAAIEAAENWEAVVFLNDLPLVWRCRNIWKTSSASSGNGIKIPVTVFAWMVGLA